MTKITLKAARVNSGLSVKQVAKKLNVHETTVLRWEENPKTIRYIVAKQLEEVYKIPMDNIFFG